MSKPEYNHVVDWSDVVEVIGAGTPTLMCEHYIQAKIDYAYAIAAAEEPEVFEVTWHEGIGTFDDETLAAAVDKRILGRPSFPGLPMTPPLAATNVATLPKDEPAPSPPRKSDSALLGAIGRKK